MPLKLSENDMEKQICDFLRAHRWTVTRQQVGLYVPYRLCGAHSRTFKPIRIGIAGMCDWRAERAVTINHMNGLVQSFEFEVKAPGKTPSKEQEAYIASRQFSGFEADWFDCYGLTDHGCSAFETWYEERFA